MGQKKVTRSLRLSPDVAERVDTLAEEKGVTKSEAYRRVIRQGIEIEDSDVTVVQGDRTIPDGGVIEERFEEIEEQTQSIASDQQLTTKIHGWMALSLVWIGFVLSLSPPSIWTAATGAVLLFGFVVNWTKEYLARKE